MSKKIIMLTQNNCPKCVVLDTYFKEGLKGRFDDAITVVHRDQQSKEFMRLVRSHGIMATPALISGDDVLHHPSKDNVVEFLEKHV